MPKPTRRDRARWIGRGVLYGCVMVLAALLAALAGCDLPDPPPESPYAAVPLGFDKVCVVQEEVRDAWERSRLTLYCRRDVVDAWVLGGVAGE